MSDSTLKELWQQVAEKKKLRSKTERTDRPERYACGPPEKAGKIQAGRAG